MEVLPHGSIPCLAGLQLRGPVSTSRSGPWSHLWEHIHPVYCWVNSRGLRWRPAWVLQSWWKRCLSWNRSSRCCLSCFRRWTWSASVGTFSSCEIRMLSSSELELLSCLWLSCSPSVGGNILGLFGVTGYSSKSSGFCNILLRALSPRNPRLQSHWWKQYLGPTVSGSDTCMLLGSLWESVGCPSVQGFLMVC